MNRSQWHERAIELESMEGVYLDQDLIEGAVETVEEL